MKREGTSTVEWGEFYCPTCKTNRQYVRKEVWRTPGTFSMRDDALKKVGEYLECATCGDTFEPDVLTRYPDKDPRPFEAIYRSLMLRVMVVMMETDARIYNDEVLRICDIYEEMIGFRLPDRILEDEINAARTTEKDIFDLVRSYAPRINDQAREKVLRAGYHVAAADGVVAQKEKDFLMSVGVAMGMTLEQIEDVLTRVKQEGWTDFRRRGGG